MGDFLDYFKTKKNLTSLLLLGIIILGLPIGIQLLKQQQILKSRATESSDPIRFIASDTEFQQTSGNNSTWATTDANISFYLYSPFGSQGTTTGTPTPTPSPTPGDNGNITPTATPVPQDQISISLNAGWNLISFPRPLIDNTLATFTDVVDKIYYFNITRNGWDWAIFRNSIWNTDPNYPFTRLEAGKAYWVNAPQARNITVNVVKRDINTAIVKPPITQNTWNMIGYSTQTDQSMNLTAYLSSVGITNWETVYRNNQGQWQIAKNGQGGTFDTVRVGEGYWVCIGTSCGVRAEVPDTTPTPSQNTPAPTATPASQSDKITINLTQGWNLISFPRSPLQPSLSATDGFDGIGNKIDKIYYSNANTDWVLAKPGIDGRWGGTLNRIEAGKGYWVNAPNATTLNIAVAGKNTGSIVRPPVTANSWNMIGYSTLTDQDMDVNAYLLSVGITNWETLYKMENGNWSIAKPTGGTFTRVNAGEGYWVKMGAAAGSPGIPPAN